jgi:hypothetical protein
LQFDCEGHYYKELAETYGNIISTLFFILVVVIFLKAFFDYKKQIQISLLIDIILFLLPIILYKANEYLVAQIPC